MDVRCAIQLARPRQWIKNVIVIVPVVFGFRMANVQAWVSAGTAFIVFCLVSSAGYVFNDIQDRERDRFHSHKKSRPLASGQVTVSAAGLEAAILLAIGFVLGLRLGYMFSAVVVSYVVLQLAYTLFAKARILIDVICIALGFVLRAAAGAVAIRVEVSPWLVICTFMLCLFMGFCKRYNEIRFIDNLKEARGHRLTLADYSPELLNHLITMSATLAVVSFLLYTTSARTIGHFGTGYLLYTVPVVVYGIFRFAMLSMKGSYGDQVDLVLYDRPFQLAVLLWAVFVFAIIFWGRPFQMWLNNHF